MADRLLAACNGFCPQLPRMQDAARPPADFQHLARHTSVTTRELFVTRFCHPMRRERVPEGDSG